MLVDRGLGRYRTRNRKQEQNEIRKGIDNAGGNEQRRRVDAFALNVDSPSGLDGLAGEYQREEDGGRVDGDDANGRPAGMREPGLRREAKVEDQESYLGEGCARHEDGAAYIYRLGKSVEGQLPKIGGLAYGLATHDFEEHISFDWLFPGMDASCLYSHGPCRSVSLDGLGIKQGGSHRW